jgi:RimJ/RimL family protein N-acetyltransferase
MIETARIRLRPWRDADLDAFAAMQSDPDVMWDQGGPVGRAQSAAKLARYRDAFDRHGYCRWAMETLEGTFLGYVGVQPSRPDHPLGDHVEIGWRLVRSAWGFGHATEGARAALADFFRRRGATEVLAYTAPDNLRSQAVMARLGLERDASRDFVMDDGGKPWSGLMWVARSE